MRDTIKINDLSKNTSLIGKILILPDYIKRNCPKKDMYIYSGWNKGFWCKAKMDDERIYPVFFENYDEVKNWKVKAV